ncbi:cbb3-type cytochrome oxidase subunit 3 [Ramlibacter sp.]
MDITTMRVAATLASLGVFLGIAVWAYWKPNREGFDEAARLPFLDDGEGR